MPRKTKSPASASFATTQASMRPRPDAAENPRRPARTGGRPASCFNEAAARCRGKRPRQAARRRRRPCFNEAAARCRGKRRLAGAAPTGELVLQ